MLNKFVIFSISMVFSLPDMTYYRFYLN